MLNNRLAIPGIVKSMGLVFGDIGTSPIYTLTAIFLIVTPTPQNVMGILSLIFWTLTILVTIEYTYLAMHLGKKGEGGTIVLKEILLPLLKSGNQVAFVSLLAIVGISIWFGFYTSRHVGYENRLWWEYSFDNDASRLLRGMAGSAMILVFVALLQYFRPAPPRASRR